MSKPKVWNVNIHMRNSVILKLSMKCYYLSIYAVFKCAQWCVGHCDNQCATRQPEEAAKPVCYSCTLSLHWRPPWRLWWQVRRVSQLLMIVEELPLSCCLCQLVFSHNRKSVHSQSKLVPAIYFCEFSPTPRTNAAWNARHALLGCQAIWLPAPGDAKMCHFCSSVLQHANL